MFSEITTSSRDDYFQKNKATKSMTNGKINMGAFHEVQSHGNPQSQEWSPLCTLTLLHLQVISTSLLL